MFLQEEIKKMSTSSFKPMRIKVNFSKIWIDMELTHHHQMMSDQQQKISDVLACEQRHLLATPSRNNELFYINPFIFFREYSSTVCTYAHS